MNDKKLLSLIETFALAFYHRLQCEPKKLMMGFTERRTNVCYKDLYFDVREVSGMNITTGEYVTRIYIDIPRHIMNKGELAVSWKSGDNRTEDINLRKRACYELAERFVEEVLPKVDFDINKSIYNRNIEKILSVLE